MAKEKKTFRETRAYPVIFMIIITFFFIGILATFYQVTLDRVEKYNQTQLKLLVLNNFNLPTKDIDADFSRFITTVEKDDLIYYTATKDEKFLGYCFPISGGGLWGTIDALLAVTPDFSQVINLEIVTQNETPGLGGRITEEWFKNQFIGKVLFLDGTLGKYQMVAEGEKLESNQVNQITGATASSKAVVDMIYKNMLIIEEKLRAEL